MSDNEIKAPRSFRFYALETVAFTFALLWVFKVAMLTQGYENLDLAAMRWLFVPLNDLPFWLVSVITVPLFVVFFWLTIRQPSREQARRDRNADAKKRDLQTVFLRAAGSFLIIGGVTILVAKALRSLNIIGANVVAINPITWFTPSLDRLPTLPISVFALIGAIMGGLFVYRSFKPADEELSE